MALAAMTRQGLLEIVADAAEAFILERSALAYHAMVHTLVTLRMSERTERAADAVKVPEPASANSSSPRPRPKLFYGNFEIEDESP